MFGKFVVGEKEPYEYLVKSIDKFMNQNELLDIYDYFQQKIELIRSKGIKHNNIILDQGIGFGKNLKHNMNLFKRISIFHSLGFPVLVGNSRKKFIMDILQR